MTTQRLYEFDLQTNTHVIGQAYQNAAKLYGWEIIKCEQQSRRGIHQSLQGYDQSLTVTLTNNAGKAEQAYVVPGITLDDWIQVVENLSKPRPDYASMATYHGVLVPQASNAVKLK